MAVSINGTTLTFNDSTTMTTAATGTVSSVATGNGLTGGTITTSGTISLDYYTGTNASNTSFPVGSYVMGMGNGAQANQVNTLRLFSAGGAGTTYYVQAGGTQLAGTWRSRGGSGPNGCCGLTPNLSQRTA